MTQPTDDAALNYILGKLVNYVGGNDTAKEFTIKEAKQALAAHFAKKQELAEKAAELRGAKAMERIIGSSPDPRTAAQKYLRKLEGSDE